MKKSLKSFLGISEYRLIDLLELTIKCFCSGNSNIDGKETVFF